MNRWIEAACRGLMLAFAAAVLAVMPCAAFGAEDGVKAQIGVGLTPANFPRHSGEDVAAMYQRAVAIGKLAVINCRWNDPEHLTVAENMLRLAERYKLQAVVQLDVLVEGGVNLAPPGGSSERRLSSASVAAYEDSARRLAALHPPFLALGIDVNRLLANGPEYLAAFAEAYKRAYDIAKAESPRTKVFVSFNWDIFVNAAASHNLAMSKLSAFVDLFRPKLDVLALTSVPTEKFASASKAPSGYYAEIAALNANEPVLLELGWPSSVGGEREQAEFVKAIPRLLGGVEPKWITWLILHDLPVPGSPAATLGLYDAKGDEKPAVKAFRALRGAQAGKDAPGRSDAKAESEPARRNAKDRFAIYTNSLQGDDPKLLISDPSREINHAHISPDGTQLVFTRYNVRDAEGVALETTSYFETEIVLCASSGSNCKSIVPPTAGVIAANASWTPDGQSLLFITTATSGRRPAIARYDLKSGRIEPFHRSSTLDLADPHMARGLTVMTGSRNDGESKLSRVYLLSKKDAASFRPLTEPKIKNFRALDPPLGDHDPKLSPDATRVAVMRHYDKDEWGLVVVDVASGEERPISEPGSVDAVPEWSSDGQKLAFWRVDTRNIKKSGLYVAHADGSDRRRIPLPPGYFYTMPVFVPGDDNRILYSAQIKPDM